MRLPALAICALSILPLAASADSMRCGKWIVNEMTSSAEILEKCGEPQSKEITKSDVQSRNGLGYMVKTGVTVTERWYYKRSSGSLTMMVRVVDDKVISIERAE